MFSHARKDFYGRGLNYHALAIGGKGELAHAQRGGRPSVGHRGRSERWDADAGKLRSRSSGRYGRLIARSGRPRCRSGEPVATVKTLGGRTQRVRSSPSSPRDLADSRFSPTEQLPFVAEDWLLRGSQPRGTSLPYVSRTSTHRLSDAPASRDRQFQAANRSQVGWSGVAARRSLIRV